MHHLHKVHKMNTQKEKLCISIHSSKLLNRF